MTVNSGFIKRKLFMFASIFQTFPRLEGCLVEILSADGSFAGAFLAEEAASASLPREAPRLCRGGSSSLTYPGVHQGNSKS
jgi:hypothetical protein